MASLYVNHLIHEHSPYLQQHAYNPVEWYAWGEKAIAKAQKENKPILLSIGYAACHWCHVMAHESFEDNETAAMMNQLFVNIKVDKEERPDLDKVYQTAHYYLSQQSGGWPLTIFLTPDLTPFFSGTYFPHEERYQLPSFKKVLQIIAKIYKNQQSDIQKQGTELRRILQQQNTTTALSLNTQPLEQALHNLEHNYDQQFGGFGDAPKFPQPTRLEYLLKNKPNLVLTTLKHMAKGGIYDQLGGGFYRYSIDRKWNIPHFEKMLYDNGQLLSLYTLAAQYYEESTLNPYIKATADWVIDLMQAPQGGYYSSLDADSEGEEGKFYRWEKTEIYSLLTPQEYEIISLFYGLDKAPNFEGYWHFYQAQSIETISSVLQKSLTDVSDLLISAQRKLLEARHQRVLPFRDEKILTSWNALMIKGVLLAGSYLKEDKYIKSAERALHFIQTTLWDGQSLCASYKNGEAYLLGYLDDYVFLLDALLTALEVKWNSNYLSFAIELANSILTHFPDEVGGFFFTAENHEKLLYRPKPMMDDAIPSGNGLLTRAFIVLGRLLDDTRYINAAEQTLKAAWTLLIRYPAEHCALLLGLKEFLDPPEMIIIRGEKTDMKVWQKLAKTGGNYTFAIPTKEILPNSLASKKPEGKCCAYICQGTQCREVITDLASFKNYLSSKLT